MHTPADPVARLEWMDRVGIDATNVLCLEGAGYVHNESNPEPLAHYDSLFGGLDTAATRHFLGGNIAECFSRMGDPLPVAATAR